MKLTDKERKVLACVELQADMPIDQVRKQSGLRDHTIRYALKRLEERGIIQKIPVVNLSVMGFTMHNIFFSLSAESSRQKNSLAFSETTTYWNT